MSCIWKVSQLTFNHNHRINANNTQNWETVGNRTGDPSDSNLSSAESCVHVNVTGYSCSPAVSRDRSDPVSFPGRQVNLTWDEPGLAVGPSLLQLQVSRPLSRGFRSSTSLTLR